jgi:DNA invertase Pin-like site-specific DNA recombinase
MDETKLLEIRTYGQHFKNSPNEKFLLMILCSQAKLENDNKSINVKRGLRTRCEMGLRPGPAVVGYLNEKRMDKKCEVVIDPERAPIVKQMFEKVAYEFGDPVKEFIENKIKPTSQKIPNKRDRGTFVG